MSNFFDKHALKFINSYNHVFAEVSGNWHNVTASIPMCLSLDEYLARTNLIIVTENRSDMLSAVCLGINQVIT